MRNARTSSPFQESQHQHGRCLDQAMGAAEAVCRRRGLRFTAQRRRVLELIWGSHKPAKAYDLLKMLQRSHPHAAPPTVYRALEFLLEAGLIHRLESMNAYLGCGSPHIPHVGQFLICRECQVTAEINDAAISRVMVRGTRRLGFQPDHQTIEIRGLCPRCSVA